MFVALRYGPRVPVCLLGRATPGDNVSVFATDMSGSSHPFKMSRIVWRVKRPEFVTPVPVEIKLSTSMEHPCVVKAFAV